MSELLPIHHIHEQFQQALQGGHVIVQSPTGSGKSTQLPLWCMNYGKVLVIEPRRLACRSLARHVANLHGCKLGQDVGYAVRFDSQYSKNTQLVFVTPGIALRWFSNSGLKEFSTIVLDEFHERRWDTDLIAALLKHHINGHDARRIVITSATMNGERLARYLSATLLTTEGRAFPVQIRYTEQRELPRLKDIEFKILDCIKDLVEKNNDGDILVFLPGRAEIQSTLNLLQNKVDAEIIPLHAGIDNKTQDQALQASKRRRIILSTNVAETSLTIPGVSMVVDSGLERRTHHRNARTVLGLHPISQAAADQRCGRAGRLGPGQCVRLWGQQARLETFTPPETEREELTELILAAAASGTATNQLEFPDPLPQHALERAHQLLVSMQAIDNNGLLTQHGQRLFPLPLDPLFAHLITAMPDSQTQSAMIDLSAALTVGRPLLQKFSKENQWQALKKWVPLNCDVATLMALMRQQAPKDIPVNQKALKEARQISIQTHHALDLSTKNLGDHYERKTLLESIIRARPELVFVRRQKRRDALGNGFTEVEIGRESRFDEQDEAAIVLDQHSAPAKGTKKTVNRATIMAPVSFQLLNQLSFGEITFTDPVWINQQIKVTRQRIYAGRSISEELVTPHGHAAGDALATLILKQKLMPDAGIKLIEDIDAFNLFNVIENRKSEPVMPHPWLVSRLQQLGVQSAEDMLLIENKDLHFPGIPEWERESFGRRYPRLVCLSNLTMNVEYEARKKFVTLVKTEGTRKTAPQLKELPLWSGWSVQFRDASRVIKIK